MYNPTDRLERALGTRSDQRFSDPPVPHLQSSKVSHQQTGQDWLSPTFPGTENLRLCPSHLPGTQWLGGWDREGRDGHGLLLGLEQAFVPGKTECNHTWDLLGESLGLWEGVPRLQAPGRAWGCCWTRPRAHPGEGDVI